MKNSIYASVVALAFVFAGSSFAAPAAARTAPLCEAVFGGNIGTAVNSGTAATGGGFDFGGGAWNLGAGASYHHLFTDNIQLGGKVNVAIGDSGTATVIGLGALVGPTFNFMNSVAGDISDAMFVFAGAGVAFTDPGSTDFQFGAEVGKRMKLADNISYRPSVGFTKVGSGSLAFNVNLLNISVLY